MLGVAALALILLVAFVYFLAALSGALVIVVVAVFLAYLIVPVVQLLRRRLPIVAAVTVTYLVVLVVAVSVLLLIVPQLVSQAQQFWTAIPSILETLRRSIDGSGVYGKLTPQARDYVDAIPAEVAKLLASEGPRLAQRGLSAVLSAASGALALLIAPILAAYLIFDAAELKRAVLGFIPARSRPKALAIMSDLNSVLGGFIRGQILDGAIVGTLIWVMLSLNHVPYAPLIGVASGILNMVPYLSILAIVPSVGLALAYNGWQDALLVAALFAVIQQIDGNFIEPFVMRVNVRLPPVMLILSIIVFSVLFGPLGTFLAVPVTAMLRVIKLHTAPAPDQSEVDAAEERAFALRRT
jgi:predicted PurR-regulated permease PerM